MTIAIYARVSSDQQAETGTIDSQVALLLEHAIRQGTVVPPELQFIDAGYSGATLVRPALERLRDVADAGGIDRLYVLAPDRLARKYAYQVLLLEELQRAGVQVCFLNREGKQSPEDELLLHVQGMIAEYERAQFWERSRRGRRYAALTGAVSALAHAPYGYRYLRKDDAGEQAHFEIQLAEGRVVQQIFTWVGIERLSSRAVCRRLAERPILTPTGKERWSSATVWGMLTNRVYIGVAAFGKTRAVPAQPRRRLPRGHTFPARHATSSQSIPCEEWIEIPVPALIDAALFHTVQDQLAENRQRARQRHWGARYLLQGLVVCAVCGYAYYGKGIGAKVGQGHKRRYSYYQCPGADGYRFGGEPVCTNRAVRTELLEQAIGEEVVAVLQHPQRLREEYERRKQAVAQETTQERHVLEAQLAKLRQGIARLIDSYTDGMITRQEFEPRLARLRQRIKGLEDELQDRQGQEQERAEMQLIVSRWEDFAQRVADGLSNLTWAEQRDIIRTVVKQVEIGREDVTIVYRITPTPFVASPEQLLLPYCSGRGLATPGCRPHGIA